MREESPSTTFSVRFGAVFAAGEDPVSIRSLGNVGKKIPTAPAANLYALLCAPKSKESLFS